MKKPILFIMLMLFMLCLAINVSAEQLYYNDEYHYYDAGEIGMIVNGEKITGLPMAPVIINDYTMVPVRELFETIGSEVIWHDDTCRVEIRDNGVSVFVKIGDRNAYIGDKLTVIEEPQPLPMLIGKDPSLLKTMVPVRFIAEKLGYSVEWDNDARTVIIETEEDDSDLIFGETEPEEGYIPEEEGVFGSVTVESDSKYDYVYIATSVGISPKVTRYTSPERIVFDFPGAEFIGKGKTIELDGNSVGQVRYANHDDAARLVLDITDSTQAFIMSSDKGILIRAEKTANDSVVYDAFAKRVYFNKSYAGSGKKETNGYKVTFTNLKLKSQTIKVKDGIIDEIKITATTTGCVVLVTGSDKLTYTAEKGFYMSDNPVPDISPDTDIKVDGEKCVVIDAGHGGDDPGAIGYDSSGKDIAHESEINLAIALLVGKKLEAAGVDVIYTRKKDNYISLAERSEVANNSDCDLFVSIHCNSIVKPEISGTQVYYHPISEVGTELAENIYDNIVDLTGLAPKKTQNGSHLYVIRSTVSPAVLVETAFISNESDRKYLMSSSGQETLAEAIYRGIMETLDNM